MRGILGKVMMKSDIDRILSYTVLAPAAIVQVYARQFGI